MDKPQDPEAAETVQTTSVPAVDLPRLVRLSYSGSCNSRDGNFAYRAEDESVLLLEHLVNKSWVTDVELPPAIILAEAHGWRIVTSGEPNAEMRDGERKTDSNTTDQL